MLTWLTFACSVRYLKITQLQLQKSYNPLHDNFTLRCVAVREIARCVGSYTDFISRPIWQDNSTQAYSYGDLQVYRVTMAKGRWDKSLYIKVIDKGSNSSIACGILVYSLFYSCHDPELTVRIGSWSCVHYSRTSIIVWLPHWKSVLSNWNCSAFAESGNWEVHILHLTHMAPLLVTKRLIEYPTARGTKSSFTLAH